MAKNIIIIASGLTERQTIPHLVRHLVTEQINVLDVRIPAANGALTPERARQIIKAVWYEMKDTSPTPHKLVVLVDVDNRVPEDIIRRYSREVWK